MIVQTIIFAVLLLVMWTIVILLVWHDAKRPKIVSCKDCKWFNSVGCAIYIVDESDKPKENDFCSFGERKKAQQAVSE